MNVSQRFPELAPVLAGADHVDVKVVEGETTLREFLAAMVAYQPGWVTFLYRIRAVFVGFLGVRQKGIPRPIHLLPHEVPMQPGQRYAFFTVRAAKENRYFVAEIGDLHLKAALCVVREPRQGLRNRFYVVTVVHYRNWASPVYFNVIRPFHHLVVGQMARAGAHGL